MGGVTETWRRPVNAHGEESVGLVHGEFQRSITWYIDGEHQYDDAERMRHGLVCPECLSPFPAAPNKSNIKTWEKYAHEWAGVRNKHQVLALVAENKCPTCASEVSSAMFALSFKGVDPHATQPLKNIIDS